VVGLVSAETLFASFDGGVALFDALEVDPQVNLLVRVYVVLDVLETGAESMVIEFYEDAD